MPSNSSGLRHYERRPLAEAGLGGPPPWRRRRTAPWKSKPAYRRSRERLGHDQRRGAVPAADVGDGRAGLQLRGDPLEAREPLGDEAGPVPGAEELGDALEHARVVVAPREPTVAPEGVHHPLHVDEEGAQRAEAAGDEHRCIAIGERQGLLGGQLVGPAATSADTYPAAACWSSHSWTSRSFVPVAVASSAAVIGPAPAIASYRPSSSPRQTIAMVVAPPRSPTTLPMNGDQLLFVELRHHIPPRLRPTTTVSPCRGDCKRFRRSSCRAPPPSS